MSTVDLVEHALLEQLLRGEFEPGARLAQDHLADELGVSKIPVREALQRLAGRGLLRFEANRGALVPHLSAAEAEENFALRRAIEPVLLSRALPNQTIVDFAEAELALDTRQDVIYQNWVFHRSLYEASGWDRGVSIARILHASVAPYVRLYIESLGGKVDSDAEHHALLQACRDHDESTAVELLHTHLDNAETALTSFLANRADDGASGDR